MLVTKARLQPGEWVLIWGVGGGVGTAALAIAKALGGRAIVTSSSDAKLARARELGADEALNHDTEDIPTRVRELTGGGANVVIESVGDATWKRSLASTAREGRVVVCGATTGPNPPASLNRIWWRELSVLGSTMGTPGDFQGAYDLVVSGRALPVVDEVFPLAEAAAAHERLERGEQLGKIVLRIPG
jgi:NADPH:quinone reductase-like Zn-dependent oxidoreductase